MHPGFVVYNTETLLKIRKACGNNVGANLDPSHLFWQGMEPIDVVRALGKAIFHVHAKDSLVYPQNARVNGVLDTKHYGDEIPARGSSAPAALATASSGGRISCPPAHVGYGPRIEIEHEDSLMSQQRRLRKAASA